jgi:hypothetical protein
MRQQTGNEHFPGRCTSMWIILGLPTRTNLDARDSSRLAKMTFVASQATTFKRWEMPELSIFELEIGMTEKADEVSHK